MRFPRNVCTYLPYCTFLIPQQPFMLEVTIFLHERIICPLCINYNYCSVISVVIYRSGPYSSTPTMTLLGLGHMTSTLFFFNFHPSPICSDILLGVRWIALSNLGTSKAFISLPYNKLPPGKRNTIRNEEFFFGGGGDLRWDGVLYDSVTTYCMLQGMMG